MTELEKILKNLHDLRRYIEDKEWSDETVTAYILAVIEAEKLLKEQEEKMKHLNNITLEYEKEVFRLQTLLKEQEEYVSVPFSWLVKFCTHIDFKEPMSDSEREQKWKKKLNQQFGIVT